ncbi:hypothetical protein [Phormidesmis priestleyi]
MDLHSTITLTWHKSMRSGNRYIERADQIAAEKAFFEAGGEE